MPTDTYLLQVEPNDSEHNALFCRSTSLTGCKIKIDCFSFKDACILSLILCLVTMQDRQFSA